MKNKVFLLLFIIIIFISGCVLNFSQETNKDELIKLKVGIMPITDCLQFFVAKEKGFFIEQGLDVEAVTMSGGAEIAPAIERGELDIGFSNILSILIFHSEGSDFKFLSPGAYKDEDSAGISKILVKKDSQINSPKDIEGKTIAINTLNNIMELVLKAWTEKNDVDYETLNVVAVPFPLMESTLEYGEIDVAFAIEPFPSLMIENNVGKVLDPKPFDAVSDEFFIASWIAKESWVSENKEKTERFVSAIMKANQYLIENPEELSDIITRNSRMSDEMAKKVTITSFLEKPKKQHLQVIIDYALKYGYITDKINVKDVTFDEFEMEW